MAVELREAGTGDRDTIVGLLDAYLEEIAVHREIPVGATNARSYLYLDAYFRTGTGHLSEAKRLISRKRAFNSCSAQERQGDEGLSAGR